MASRFGLVLSVVLSATVLLAVGSQPTQACLIGKYFRPITVDPNLVLDGVDFTAMPSFTNSDPQINFPAGSDFYPGGSTELAFAAEWTGLIDIAVPGFYKFFTTSDDASRLYIGGILLVDNNFYQGMTERSSAPIDLNAGLHDFRVTYFQQGGDRGCIASWLPPGGTEEVIPIDVLACPEPATLALLALGGLAAILRRRGR